MNPLHLSGFGVRLRVRKLSTHSELEIRNGHDGITQPYVSSSYRPRRFPNDSIFVESHSGYFTLEAIRWLSKHKIPLFVLNFDGSLISSILPPMPVKADLRSAQLDASRNLRTKEKIARGLVEAKMVRSCQVLDWLAERYDIAKDVLEVKREAMKLGRARTVEMIRSAEGRLALKYWAAYGKVLPESLDFQGRMTSSHQNNATDPVNTALNYGYGFLEGECRRAINSVGLEPSVGFLHDFSNYQTKQSLVYDLEEPFRWIVDLTVMRAFESGALDVPHFYFTGDDYRYRFDAEAKTRFINLLREQFNSGVRCKGRVLKWDTVIEQKTSELGRYLIGKSTKFNLLEPAPILTRNDSQIIRERILQMTQSQAEKLGIGRSTLHYMRKNARKSESFNVYRKTRQVLK